MVIGIPRALLYYYYKDIWIEFFSKLGIKTIVSPPTNKEILKRGVALGVDEACFSSKIYLGHVDWLVNRCDMIFVPRFENVGIREDFCPRIFGMYDVTRRTFPNATLLNSDVNFILRRREINAYIDIAKQLGFTQEQAESAYHTALEKSGQKHIEAVSKQEEVLSKDGLKVLLVSHSYNLHDAYIGGPIIEYFKKNNVHVIYDDIADTDATKEKVREIHGSRVYWKINRDLLGGIELYKDKVDGIVLITTFPCGPDSVFNEMIIRNIKCKPILSLMIDELDATAGLQTRLESFVDILSARKKGGCK